MVLFTCMPLSTEYRCFVEQRLIIPFLVGSVSVQKGHLNSGVVVAGILVLLSVVGVVGVGAGVEASSEAW